MGIVVSNDSGATLETFLFSRVIPFMNHYLHTCIDSLISDTRLRIFSSVLFLYHNHMSSTNRNKTARSELDYYVTPHSDIQKFLDAFLANHPEIDLSQLSILDPCAWWDETHPMSYPSVLESYHPKSITTNDIREDSRAEYHLDFLSRWTPNEPKYDIVITNPPFNIALDIIKKSIEFATPAGYVIMLLRLNFFGSKARKAFFDQHMPIETYVHHKRISFAKGATDSIEYMHCVWKKGYNPPFTKLFLI